MIKQLYVAGPVIGSSRTLETAIKEAFTSIKQQATAMGFESVMPTLDPELDAMLPQDFSSTIRARMSEALGVVCVIWPGDQAVVVESVIASELGKPQLILARTLEEVPRMLRALPNVRFVVEMSSGPSAVRGCLDEFLKAVE